MTYIGTRGGFTRNIKSISNLLPTPSAQGVCHFCSPHRCTLLHAQILRSTVLGQSLLNASPRLLAALPPLGTSSFISVPQNLSHTSSNPQPTGVNRSFKSFFPALPANTFNSQSLITSHVDGVVNAELQTSRHLPKVTPRVLEIKTRSPDSHTLVLNIPSVPSIIVTMEIILMPPIPHQDIAEMVQQKLYISPPRQRKHPSLLQLSW